MNCRTTVITALLCALLLINVTVQQQPPGFSTIIQESSLNYMARQAIPLVVAKVLSLTIPEVDQEVHSPIGKIDIRLYDMHINTFCK
jgi:hypothetical protein